MQAATPILFHVFFIAVKYVVPCLFAIVIFEILKAKKKFKAKERSGMARVKINLL